MAALEAPISNGAAEVPDAAAQVVEAIAQADAISADEIALYDRQIRLWGVQAQGKIRTANILLISIKALANEVAKNLVLAGIGSLTLCDHQPVTADDLASQFLISEEDISKNRAEAAAVEVRKLNPRVKVHVDTEDVRSKSQAYYAAFDIIIATDVDFDTMSTINAATRLSNRPFYAAGAHGFYGYVFADLIMHDYVIERKMSNVPTKLEAESATRSVVASSTKKQNGENIELVTKRELYSPLLLANSSPLAPEILNNRRKLRQVPPLLSCLRALWDFQRAAAGAMPSHSRQDIEMFTRLATDRHKELQLPMETLKSEFLRKFLQNLGSELAPVTAFLGGQLAQDIINVLGKREQPIQNMLLFDGDSFAAPIYALHPVFMP